MGQGWELGFEAHGVLDRDLKGNAGTALFVEAPDNRYFLEDIAAQLLGHQEQDKIPLTREVKAEKCLLGHQPLASPRAEVMTEAPVAPAARAAWSMVSVWSSSTKAIISLNFICGSFQTAALAQPFAELCIAHDSDNREQTGKGN